MRPIRSPFALAFVLSVYFNFHFSNRSRVGGVGGIGEDEYIRPGMSAGNSGHMFYTW